MGRSGGEADILESPVGQVEVVDVAAAGRVGADLPQPKTLLSCGVPQTKFEQRM